MFNRKWTAALVIMNFLWFSCSVNDIAGNGSQTGNPMIVGKMLTDDKLTPACNATVFLRTRTTTSLPDIMAMKQLSDTVALTKTRSDGTFAIDSIDTGLYVIEGIYKENYLVFIDSVHVQYFDSTLVLPSAVLNAAGAIKGTIDLSEGGDPRKVFVIIPELDKFTTADTSGNFKFENCAEGHYTITIIPTLDNYGVFDTSNIPVTSADTTVLDAINLFYTGIPIIKGIEISYDTLQQQVKLIWNRPTTSLVRSFNVYRRETDPVSAFIAQLNFYPITDTFYIDSLCQQNKSYEYHVTAVDTNTNEGVRSTGVTTRIALYNVVPDNVVMIYDTVRQTATLRWSNPDTARVKSFNVYKRNVNLNEKFWTPFNNSPITDTFFIDSTFSFYQNDSSDRNGLIYEYCVTALVQDLREGTRSPAITLNVHSRHLIPADLNYTYDTLNQTVHLQWNRPDMTIVRGFTVYRRRVDSTGNVFSPISDLIENDTFYTDSTGLQNQSYEYRIGSMIKNNRSDVKSAKVKVHFAASFFEDTVFTNDDGTLHLSFPNDLSVTAKGNIYVLNQGSGCIDVFDSTMNFKLCIGKGILDYALKMSIDEQGMIFVSDYNLKHGLNSVFIFDKTGMATDTILESWIINDLDVKNGVLYTLSDGQTISMHSYDGTIIRSWQLGKQYDGKCITAADVNRIIISAGLLLPDKSNIIVFDSLGNAVSSKMVPFFPNSIAFDESRQLLYTVSYDGLHGNIIRVFDTFNIELARYKIQYDNQNCFTGIQTGNVVLIVLKNEDKIIRLKPTAAF